MGEVNFDKTTIHLVNRAMPIEARKSFEHYLKRGIYKELHRRKLLSDIQLSDLLKTR